MSSTDTACSCPSQERKKRVKGKYSIYSGILIALIPKCPYCILAYSSAITMCSGTRIYSQTPGWTSYLLIGLAILTLFLVIFNYRGKRTLVSAGLVAAGSLFMLLGQFYTYQMTHYYLGTFLLLFGVWFNASFLFFYRKWLAALLLDQSFSKPRE